MVSGAEPLSGRGASAENPTLSKTSAPLSLTGGGQAYSFFLGEVFLNLSW